MVDQASQHRAIEILSTTTAEMIEDIDPIAVLRVVSAPPDRSQQFKQLGDDIIALAKAIMVLERIGADDVPG